MTDTHTKIAEHLQAAATDVRDRLQPEYAEAVERLAELREETATLQQRIAELDAQWQAGLSAAFGATVTTVKQGKAPPLRDHIITVLRQHGGRATTQQIAAALEPTGVSRSAISQARAALLKAGHITRRRHPQGKRGELYELV